ncbi:MAG: glycosyltransferase family 2 protein [Christensenellales bacterium]
MKPIYSVIIPAYNEEDVLEESYRRLKKTADAFDGAYELIFVNDGSKDKTTEILDKLAEKDKTVKAIHFSRNFGHQIAVSAGMDHAQGDAVIIIDCDLQDPPEVIPQMIDKWREGYEVVYGKRLKREGESVFKKFTAFCFYRTLNAMSKQNIPLDTGDFRLIDKKVRDAMCAMKEKSRFLRGMANWVGYKQAPVEYYRDARWAGKTKYTLSKMLKLAGDGITSFSSKPLKITALLGGLTCFFAFLYLVLTIVLRAVGVAMPAWNYGVAAIVFLQGTILLMLGIIGVYIGRIFDEAKDRPLYIVAKKTNFEE